MTTPRWFEDVPVLGKLPLDEAAGKLRTLGEADAAAALALAAQEHPQTVAYGGGLSELWPFRDRAWQHTAHAFGHLAVSAPGSNLRSLQHAGNITADATLKNSRVRITLDRLRVADYPGGGTHRVLFDFYAQNQLPGNVEHLHFNGTFRVRE